MPECVKTFLEPRALRRGAPVLQFIVKSRSASDRRKNRYDLGTYYDLQPIKKPPYKGIGSEYQGVMRTTVRKETYEALLKEAKMRQQQMMAAGEVQASIEGD